MNPTPIDLLQTPARIVVTENDNATISPTERKLQASTERNAMATVTASPTTSPSTKAKAKMPTILRAARRLVAIRAKAAAIYTEFHVQEDKELLSALVDRIESETEAAGES